MYAGVDRPRNNEIGCGVNGEGGNGLEVRSSGGYLTAGASLDETPHVR